MSVRHIAVLVRWPLDLSGSRSVLDELQLHLRQILTEYAQHYNDIDLTVAGNSDLRCTSPVSHRCDRPDQCRQAVQGLISAYWRAA